jgi:hypothetical protein
VVLPAALRQRPGLQRLLDPSENGSLWAFELEDFARSEQWYEPNTAVLRTRLYDRQGQGIEITDFAPRFWSRGRTFPAADDGAPRAGAGRHAAHAGGAAPALRLGPRASRASPAAAPTSATSAPQQTLRVNTDAPIDYILSETFFVVDRPMNFILGPDETLASGIEDTARAFEQDTASYWRSWTRALSLPLEWQDAVIRAAITLKLSLFEDTGAIVAAMTTSIPEAPTAAATGTTATAGCATPSSWCARSTASPKWRPWRSTCAG